MSNLEPGLYRATVRGVADVTVFVTENSLGYTKTSVGDATMHSPSRDITDARPLIVLNFEDPAEVVRSLRAEISPWHFIEDIADAIEAQIKPAKIDEPGRWGVVEAALNSLPNAERFTFFREANPRPWMCTEDGNAFCWAGLIDPVLIREGVAL